jgi:hypothetical protein
MNIKSGQDLMGETAMALTTPELALTLHFDVVELKQQVHLSACCPVENRQTVSHQLRQISLEPGNGLWWRCLCCNGWHIIVFSEEDIPWPDMGQIKEK